MMPVLFWQVSGNHCQVRDCGGTGMHRHFSITLVVEK
jgi:hypothetical protein